MQHIFYRCKHCGRSYTYCTYGNGPEYGTELGCSMEYCGECQTAINNALNNIQKKIEPKFMEINEPLLFPLFEKVKNECLEKTKDNLFTCNTTIKCGYHTYKHCETYHHNGKVYKVEWNDENDKHIFIQMEYDIINKKFTNNYYECNGGDAYLYYQQQTKADWDSFTKNINLNSNDQPLSEPLAILSYMDMPYEQKLENKEENIQKPKHKLRTYSLKMNGSTIKSWLDYPRYKCISKVKDEINIKSLVDFIDYEATFEKYDDEENEWLVKIECV